MQEPQGLGVFQKRVASAIPAQDLVGKIGEFESVWPLRGHTGGENPEGKGLDHVFSEPQARHADPWVGKRVLLPLQGCDGFWQPTDP